MWMEGRLSDQVYMTALYGAYIEDEADRHKWGYTEESLFNCLRLSGFVPTLFDWTQQFIGSNFAKDRWILAVKGISVL